MKNILCFETSKLRKVSTIAKNNVPFVNTYFFILLGLLLTNSFQLLAVLSVDVADDGCF